VRVDDEPVWPSGNTLLGWYWSGRCRFDSRLNSVLLSLEKSCGLWTLSCGFAPHKEWNINMAVISAHLSVEIIAVVTVYSDRNSSPCATPLAPPETNLVLNKPNEWTELTDKLAAGAVRPCVKRWNTDYTILHSCHCGKLQCQLGHKRAHKRGHKRAHKSDYKQTKQTNSQN